MVGCLLACLTSQQHASVSQGRICSDNCTCCHTEVEVANQTFHLIKSQYTDIGPTSPSADPITPGTWQGSHWSANFEVTGMTRPGKIPSQAGFELRTFRFRGGRLNHLANEAVKRKMPLGTSIRTQTTKIISVGQPCSAKFWHLLFDSSMSGGIAPTLRLLRQRAFRNSIWKPRSRVCFCF